MSILGIKVNASKHPNLISRNRKFRNLHMVNTGNCYLALFYVLSFFAHKRVKNSNTFCILFILVSGFNFLVIIPVKLKTRKGHVSNSG